MQMNKIGAVLLGCFLAAAAGAQTSRPNVVFVIADDLGWNDVGYHNPEVRTPNLDELSARGVRLTQYRVNSLCSPTRASLLTGQTAIRAGVRMAGDTLTLNRRILPEVLGDAGYQTWLVGKWHLGSPTIAHTPNERGFDHFYGLLGGAIDSFTHRLGQGDVDWQRNGTTIEEEGYATDLMVEEAIDLLDNRDPARPFFLDLSFNAPHTPLAAPQEYLDRWAHIEDPTRGAYLAMVEALDDAIGRFYAALEQRGLADNTLFVFMSDNGGDELMGGASNDPLREHKWSPFDGGIRVPAFVLWPQELAGGRELSEFFTVMDWTPTICAITGIAPPSQVMDGVDMWPSLSAGRVAERGPAILGADPSYAVFDDGWKYVEVNRGSTTRYLFRILEDPNEETDVLAENVGVAQRLRLFLAEHPAETSSELPTIASVVNGADFVSPIGPQSWVTIAGANLSTSTRTWSAADFQGANLPRELDGVSVTIDGEAAYPYYISPTQLNVLSGASPATGPVNVQVNNSQGTSDVFAAVQQSYSPAFFRFDPAGRKYVAAVHPDGVLAAPRGLFGSTESRPAQPGDAIMLYGTGLGRTDPPTADGKIVTTPRGLAEEPTVRIGGLRAEVLFAGVVSAGLVQLNVVVPDLAAGDHAITVEIGGVESQAGTWISVGP